MPISVKCGACRAAFAVRDEIGGKRIRCVRCREAISVASPTGVPGTAAQQSPKQTQSPQKSPPPRDFESLRKKVFASFTSPAIQPVPIA
jgi:hypothetical protein